MTVGMRYMKLPTMLYISKYWWLKFYLFFKIVILVYMLIFVKVAYQ